MLMQQGLPPSAIILPEVGRGEQEKPADGKAMQIFAAVLEVNGDPLVIITPTAHCSERSAILAEQAARRFFRFWLPMCSFRLIMILSWSGQLKQKAVKKGSGSFAGGRRVEMVKLVLITVLPFPLLSAESRNGIAV